MRVGIGDDAAAWQPSRSHLSVITTDALIEDVHFTRAGFSAADIGERALATNLSDIAAMGATPVLCTIALGLPIPLDLDWVRGFYQGFAALANRANTAVAGGDLVRAPAIAVSVTVVGEVRRTNLKRRDAARVGDVVATTGPLGASRAGLELVRRPELASTTSCADALLRAFRTPVPRLAEGRWLGASRNVHAMLDLSDGLSTDAHRLAVASQVAIRLEQVPLAPGVAEVAVAAGDDPERYGLDGGEDYELLVTIEHRAFAHLSRRFAAAFGRPLVALGRVAAGIGVEREREGEVHPLVPGGFDHLRTTAGGSRSPG